MHRFFLLACLFLSSQYAEATSPYAEATSKLAEAVSTVIDSPSSGLRAYATKHAPVLAKLDSLERREALKLLPNWLTELEEIQSRSDKYLKSYLISQEKLDRKDMPESRIQIVLKTNRENDPQYLFKSIKAFKTSIKIEEIFIKEITDIQLRYLLYQTSALIMQRHLEVMAREKLGNNYFKLGEETYFPMSSADLLTAYLNSNESLFEYIERKYFLPFMEVSNEAYVEAFKEQQQPSTYYMLELVDDAFIDYVAKREPLARALNIAFLCGSEQITSIQFKFLYKDWLQDLKSGVFDKKPIQTSKNKKRGKKNKKTEIVSGIEDIKQPHYPFWLEPLRNRLDILFVAANLSATEQHNILKDIDAQAESVIKSMSEATQSMHKDLLSLSEKLTTETLKKEKLEAQLTKLKGTKRANEQDVSNKANEVKVLKKELHSARTTMESLQKQMASNQKALDEAMTQEKDFELKFTSLAKMLEQEKKDGIESERQRKIAQDALDKATAKEKNLKIKITHMAEKLSKEERDHIESERQRKIAQEELERLQNKVFELQTALAKKINETHVFKQTQDSISQQYAQEIVRVSVENQQLLSLLRTIQAENTNLKGMLQNTKADLVADGKIIQSLDPNNATMSTELESYEGIYIPEQLDME